MTIQTHKTVPVRPADMKDKRTTRGPSPAGRMSRKRTTRKGPVRKAIILPWKVYLKLQQLVLWYEATPDGIYLGDHVTDHVLMRTYEALADFLGPRESATVKVGRTSLVASISDGSGRETRIPIFPAEAPARLKQHPRKGPAK